MVSWVVTPFSSERAQRFGGTHRLIPEGGRISQATDELGRVHLSGLRGVAIQPDRYVVLSVKRVRSVLSLINFKLHCSQYINNRVLGSVKLIIGN
jgi:hypothetical protein